MIIPIPHTSTNNIPMYRHIIRRDYKFCISQINADLNFISRDNINHVFSPNSLMPVRLIRDKNDFIPLCKYLSCRYVMISESIFRYTSGLINVLAGLPYCLNAVEFNPCFNVYTTKQEHIKMNVRNTLKLAVSLHHSPSKSPRNTVLIPDIV